MAPTHRQPAAFFLRLLLAVALSWPAAVRAEPPAQIGLRLGVRGLGEVWQDTHVMMAYRSSRFTASGVVSYQVWRFLGAALEVGYERQGGLNFYGHRRAPAGGSASLEVVPITLMAEASHGLGNLLLFGALGCAITPFDETGDGIVPVSGTKFGAALQVGARIDTKLIQPSMRSGEGARLQAVELEIFAGRRQHHLFGIDAEDTLDLSAWRFGAGLMARF
jgi:opacity protein-like surface antigen